MPVSGFKIGDKVKTPSGRTAEVLSIASSNPETLRVKFGPENGPVWNGAIRKFRAAALRYI